MYNYNDWFENNNNYNHNSSLFAILLQYLCFNQLVRDLKRVLVNEMLPLSLAKCTLVQ